MTLEERKKVIAACGDGFISMINYLRTRNGGCEQMIDANKLIKSIKWFCSDTTTKDLDEYIDE